MSVLVLAAHPDDEVLGCGGTIARLAAEGRRVHIVILGEGATSRDRTPAADSVEKDVAELKRMATGAAALLGAASIDFAGLPDNRFDALPLLEVVKKVEGFLDSYSPGILFTHSGGDVNIDHATVYRAAVTAARPLPGRPLRAFYSFEIPSSTEWAFGRFSPPFRPNAFFDIEAFLPKKLAAARIYADEMRDFPHPRSPEGIEALARVRGMTAGYRAAEAFECVWRVDV